MSGRPIKILLAKVSTSMVNSFDPNKHNFEATALRNIKSPDEIERIRLENTKETILIYKDGETRRVNADGSTELPNKDASAIVFKQDEKNSLAPHAPRWDWKKDGWSTTPPAAKAPVADAPAVAKAPKA